MSVTRESGNIAGNSLKSIYARIQTNSAATKALSAINVELTNIDGSSKSSSQLLAEVANKWEGLTDAQRRSTAVGIAGIYQLSRFNALMLNMSMANDAATTSLNSQGSAMREQEKYNESLEARINRLNTAWYELSNTIGNTIVYDAITVTTKAMELMTNSGEEGARKLQVLPPILATIGIATLLLSTRFRNLSASAATNSITMAKAAVSFRLTTASAMSLTYSLLGLATAFKGLLLATGVGAVFLGIGYGIEFLTRKISENIQKNEDFRNQQEKNIKALTDNKEQTEALIATYSRLSDEKNNPKLWNYEKEQEYLQIQQQLADIFPSLIAHIDSTGQAHLKSKEEIQNELEVTNQLIEAKKNLLVVSAEDTFETKLKEINKAYKEMNTLQDDIDSLDTLIGLDHYSEKDLNKMKQNKAEFEYELLELQIQVSQLSQEMIGTISELANAFNTIDINPIISKEIDGLLNKLNFDNLNSDQIKAFSRELANLEDKLTLAVEAEDEVEFDKLKGDLEKLLSTTTNYNAKLTGTVSAMNEVIESTEASRNSFGQIGDEMEDGLDNIDAFTQKLAELTEATSEYKTTAEMMAGVNDSLIDGTSELLTTYELLSAQIGEISNEQLEHLYSSQSLTAEERNLKNVIEQRKGVMELLSALYPNLLSLQSDQIELTYDQIEAVKDEHYANAVLLESYKNLYDGKYSSEQAMVLASKAGTEARIANFNAEIRALQTLISAYDNMYQGLMSTAGTSDPEVAKFMEREASKYKAANDRLSEISATVSGLRGELGATYQQLNGFNQALGGGVDRNGRGLGKSDSKGSSGSSSKDTLNEAIYLTDNLKIALERVNAEIEKQELLRSNLPEHTDKYIKSLETQRKLEKDKLEILRQQAKQLQSQIEAEKFLQTGKVITNKDSKISQSEAYADRQEALEQSRSQLLKLQQDILQQELMLSSVEKMLVDSNIANFNFRRNETDKLLATESVRLKELSINSKSYNDTLQKSNEHMLQKQRVNREELTYLNSVVKDNKLYGESLQEIKDRIHDVTLEMRELVLEIQENNYEIIINIKTQFENDRNDNQYEFDRLSKMQESLNEGTNAWLELQEEKLELQKKETQAILKQRDAMQREILNRDLTAEKISEMNREIQALTLSYYDSINAEKDLSESLVNLQKSTADSIASTLWDAYQEYVNQRRDEHMKMLDSQTKAEQDAHNKRIKQLDDEMNLFRKNVQERIALIDKSEADRDYNMGMEDLRTERESILSDYNALMLDNSRNAEKRRRDLLEKLDAIDKEIAERQRDREIDLQKEALNSLVETKQESVEYQKELEIERFNSVISSIDREKEYWEKHYQDLANDERKYAQLREDVMNGNWSKITSEFEKYIGQMKDTMPSLADTMDGTMQSVGTAIRENVIENLLEAMRLLREFQSQQAMTISANPSQNGGSGGSFSGGSTGRVGVSNSDMKVLLGKYMYETLAKNETDSVTRGFIQQKAQALAQQGRSEGSKLTNDYDLTTYLNQLGKDDLEMFARFVQTNSSIVVDSPHLQEYLKEFAKRLLLSSARLSSGGMIPNIGGLGLDGKGGRGVIVHPNEVINSPYDTDNLVNMSKILQTAVSYLNPLINKITGFNPHANTIGDGGINVEVNIDKVIGDENSGRHIGEGIASTLKTKFGRSFK